jgi:hypothetical protein
VGLEAYDIIILSSSLFFKNAYFHLSDAGFIGKNMSHILFLEKKKETVKLLPHFAFILVPKNCPPPQKKRKLKK